MRKACEILAELQKVMEEYPMIAMQVPPWTFKKKMGQVVEELQLSVNALVAAYEKKYGTGSEVRCPSCEANGGMRNVRRCIHCGVETIEEAKS